MDLDAIAVFVKVVEVGSFSGAAQLLNMPKTTVSAKVAGLEKRLGVTLIQRTTRKLHVTEAGQSYFKHCALAIKEIEAGESEVMATQDKPVGFFKVTAPVDLGHTLLPRMVCEYRRKYPEVEIELIVTNRIVDLVGEGVDLAIRAGELKDSTLVARKFVEFRASLWASPEYLKTHGTPSSIKELAQHQFVGHSVFKTTGLEMTDDKTTLSIPLDKRLRADDFETIKAMVVLGQGIGLFPEFIIAKERRSKELVPVLPKWHLKNSSAFWFVYPGQKYSSPKIRTFMEIASDFIKKEQP